MGSSNSTPTSLSQDEPTGRPLEKGMSLSAWLQGVRSSPLLDHRTTKDLPTEAEVVIIGSGITGATTTYELLKSESPPKSIVMLEAREVCSGATGRNAGHCKPDQWRGFSGYEASFGTEQALKILANEQQTWARIVEFVRLEKVQCDLWVGKTLDVATTPEVAAKALDNYKRFQAAGGNVSHIEYISDKDEAVKRSRIKSAEAVWAWDASTLYPWKLVAHILEKHCLPMGLNLQTWTPATSVTPAETGGGWVVHTDRGIISTPTVVHATNAYCAALLPELFNVVKPTPHMCDRVIPPKDWVGTKALQNSYGVLLPNGRLFSINPNLTSTGHVLFGGSNPNQHLLMKYVEEHPEKRADDSLANFEPVTRAVKEFVGKEFEGWGPDFAPGEGFDYAWSGIIGNSADGLPYVGPVPDKPGQWICAGHNGHGMARAFTCAPGLVKLIQGGTWEDTGLPEVFELTRERFERVRKIEWTVPL